MSNPTPPEINDDDFALLSAYIDNQVSDDERQALEARLADDAALRTELAALRQTVQWLNEMPALKAPRDFTLSEADVEHLPKPNIQLMPRRNWWIAGAAAAVFVIIVGIGFVLTQTDFFQVSNEAPVSLTQQVAVQPTSVPVDNNPPSPAMDDPTEQTDSGLPPPVFIPLGTEVTAIAPTEIGDEEEPLEGLPTADPAGSSQTGISSTGLASTPIDNGETLPGGLPTADPASASQTGIIEEPPPEPPSFNLQSAFDTLREMNFRNTVFRIILIVSGLLIEQ